MTEHVVDTPCVDEPAYVPDPRRWRILGVSLVIGFMALLDVSIVNVAIPSMREGLHTSAGTIQWVVSGYALAFGLTLVAGGRLGDAYGRRRLMLLGLALFIASSAAVGFAPNAALVVVARLAQGASAGLLTPQNSGLIQQLFRGAERGRAFGVFGLTVSVSSAIGPVLGGLIIALAGEENGWRWLFLVNVPIGLVAHGRRAWRWCPGSRRRARRGPTTGSTYPAPSCSAPPCCACSTRSSGWRAATGCRWSCSSASRSSAGAFVRVGAAYGAARPPAAPRPGAAAEPARLRQRAGGRRPLLHRLHRRASW